MSTSTAERFLIIREMRAMESRIMSAIGGAAASPGNDHPVILRSGNNGAGTKKKRSSNRRKVPDADRDALLPLSEAAAGRDDLHRLLIHLRYGLPVYAHVNRHGVTPGRFFLLPKVGQAQDPFSAGPDTVFRTRTPGGDFVEFTLSEFRDACGWTEDLGKSVTEESRV